VVWPATGSIGSFAGVVAIEVFPELRVAHRLAGFIDQQVLFRHVGDVLGLIIFGQQVIEWLVLVGPHVFRDCVPPFLRVVENRIHVENYAAEWKQSMADNLSYGEFCCPWIAHGC